jgi:hypothetical protein
LSEQLLQTVPAVLDKRVERHNPGGLGVKD